MNPIKFTRFLLFITVQILFTTLSIAQTTILFEDFANDSLPKGWTISKNTTSVGWQFGDSAHAVETDQGTILFAPPSHGNFAFDLDFKDNDGSSYTSDKADLDRLITPSLNLSAYKNIFVKFSSFFMGYFYTGTADTERLTFEASLDKGKTWTLIGEVYRNTSNWQNHYFNASNYAGDTGVEFCFHYNDADTILVGAAVDSLLIYEPLNYNVSVINQNLNNYYQINSPNVISGSLYNYGGQTILNMNLNWSINDGAVNKTSLSSLSIAPLSYYNYTSTINCIPTSDGKAIIKIWADSINGNLDESLLTDSLISPVTVIDTLEKRMAMLEEFENASYDPCAVALINFDSVVLNSKKFANVVRYHVKLEQDLMNSETQSQVIDRQNYYGGTDIPQFFMNGITDNSSSGSPGLIHSPHIYSTSLPGSPLRISGTYTYDLSSHKHTISTTIKSFATFPPNTFKVYAIIIDSVAFASNQSYGSIPQYYFPEVVEEILPSSGGGLLGEFKDDTSQTLNFTWDQTHRLSADFSIIDNKSFPYDSGSFSVVIFVQNFITNEILQSITIPANVVSGINEMNSGLTKVNTYPNPFNNTINLTMNLQKNENVVVKFSDILGRENLISDEGSLNSGTHTFMYDVSTLPSGIYLLYIQTDDGSLSLKEVKSN